MLERFADLPEALENTVEIAKRCNLHITLGKNFLPLFPTPDGLSRDDYLIKLSNKGLQERMVQLYPDEAERAAKMPEYQERLDFELNIIIRMKFPAISLSYKTLSTGRKRTAVRSGRDAVRARVRWWRIR